MLYKIAKYLFYAILTVYIIFMGYVLYVGLLNINFHNPENIYSLIFGLGVLVNSITTIGKLEKIDIYKILGILSIFFYISFFDGKVDFGEIVIFSGGYSVLFTLFFKEKIIKKISEIMVLITMIGFWYLILKTQLIWNIFILKGIYVIGGIFTIPVIISIFTKINKSFLKFSLYLGYILILILFGIIKFLYGDLKLDYHLNKDLINIFISGAMFSYIIMYSSYVFDLRPFPRKGESFKEMKERILEYSNILINNFTDYQIGIKTSVAIISFLGIFFYIDYNFLKLSPGNLIGIIFVFVFIIQEIQNINFNKIKIWQ